MPKHVYTRYIAWVKNVYSLRTQTGTNSERLYTPSYLNQQLLVTPVHNYLVIPQFVQVVASWLSTLKNSHFNQLYRHLYPLSTAPTNKKKKKI